MSMAVETAPPAKAPSPPRQRSNLGEALRIRAYQAGVLLALIAFWQIGL